MKANMNSQEKVAYLCGLLDAQNDVVEAVLTIEEYQHLGRKILDLIEVRVRLITDLAIPLAKEETANQAAFPQDYVSGR